MARLCPDLVESSEQGRTARARTLSDLVSNARPSFRGPNEGRGTSRINDAQRSQPHPDRNADKKSKKSCESTVQLWLKSAGHDTSGQSVHAGAEKNAVMKSKKSCEFTNSSALKLAGQHATSLTASRAGALATAPSTSETTQSYAPA